MTDVALLAAVQRLTGEVLRLRGDIARLLDRIEPFEDEQARLAPVLRDHLRPPKTPQEALSQIGHARQVIRAVEIDIQAARAKIDAIAADPDQKREFAREGIRNPHRDEAEKLFTKAGGRQ